MVVDTRMTCPDATIWKPPPHSIITAAGRDNPVRHGQPGSDPWLRGEHGARCRRRLPPVAPADGLEHLEPLAISRGERSVAAADRGPDRLQIARGELGQHRFRNEQQASQRQCPSSAVAQPFRKHPCVLVEFRRDDEFFRCVEPVEKRIPQPHRLEPHPASNEEARRRHGGLIVVRREAGEHLAIRYGSGSTKTTASAARPRLAALRTGPTAAVQNSATPSAISMTPPRMSRFLRPRAGRPTWMEKNTPAMAPTVLAA